MEQPRDPWDRLQELLDRPDAAALAAWLEALPPGEAPHLLARLREDDRERLLVQLDPQVAAGLVDRIPDAQAAGLIEQLEPQAAAAILQELQSHEQADLLGRLERPEAEAILSRMGEDEARLARRLSRYDNDVAGGLMVREFLAYPEHYTVAQVNQDLRANAARYRDYQVQYTFVTGKRGRLSGVLRMRDLVMAPPERSIRDLMIPDPLTVRDTATLDELRAVFEAHGFFGVPVVDDRGRLVGLVQRADVAQASAGRSEREYLKTQGIVGGEELRTMPLLRRSRRRLSWLRINIVLNIIAASVIAAYQETLAAVIALAVFLPIISDMSGCSGNQAVAVSLRELTLGVVRPTEALRVLASEVAVGLINGVVLGGLIAVAAWVWQGNAALGLVAGAAMAINTVVAVSIGGTVPLVLRRFGMDPALASGPILTTITDMCGFFLVLQMAAMLMSRLVVA